MNVTKIIQKNLAKHPMHPVIPSPRKLPMNPSAWIPQPRRPRTTKAKIPMPIIAMIVSIIDIFNAYHLLSCYYVSRHKKGANRIILDLKVLDYLCTQE